MIAAAQGRLTRLWKENSSYALAAGSGVIAPAIGLLTAPILTRLYTPAEFGVLGSFAAIMVAALSMANLRYEVTVPLPKREEEAYSLALAAMRIGVAGSLVITGLFVALAPFIFGEEMRSKLLPYVWWLPIALMLAATQQTLTQFAVRRGAFGELARARLVQGVTGPVVQIGAGLAGIGVVGLLIGQAASQSGGVLRLWRFFRGVGKDFTEIPPSGPLLKRYRHFPKYSLFPAFINALGMQLPVLIVARMHGMAAAGLILLILRVMNTPIGILGSAANQTLVTEAAKLRREGQRTLPVINKTVKRQFVLNLPFMIVTPFLPWIFPRLFGAEWADAGKYALVLVPALVISVGLIGPTSAIFDIHERQRLQLYREIVRVIVITVAVVVAKYWFGGTMWAIISALSAALIFNSALGYWLAVQTGKQAPRAVTAGA